jgi:hypothetical protein
MTNKSIHICRFDSTSDIKKPTYDKIKQRVLEVGRFSVFDATRNQVTARIFTSLERDPELVLTRVGFPWVKVERKRE